MNKGIFWLITNQSGEKELLCIKVACDAMGDPKEPVMFSSKSGENFNHKAEWSKLSPRLTLGKPFNYFPRGHRNQKRQGNRVLPSGTYPTPISKLDHKGL